MAYPRRASSAASWRLPVSRSGFLRIRLSVAVCFHWLVDYDSNCINVLVIASHRHLRFATLAIAVD